MSTATKPKWAQLAWGLGRVPLLLAVAYVLRHPVLNAIERVFDIIWITELVVDLMSTPLARLCLALGVFVILVGVWAAARRLGALLGYIVAVLVGGGVLAAVIVLTDSPDKWAVLLPALLAANWLPDELIGGWKLPERAAKATVVAVPVLGEGLFASRWLSWIVESAGLKALDRKTLLFGAVPGALVSVLALAIFVNGASFAPFERSVRGGPEVKVVAEGDINGLALEKSGRNLIVTGHGAQNLLKYDVTDWSHVQSRATTGGAQGLAYDPDADEVLVFDLSQRAVLVFDTNTLEMKRSVPAPDLSPGDPWIGVDAHANTIVLASEADEQSGVPLLVLDRDTGAVVDKRREEVGNLLSRPDRSFVYFSFFRRGQGVLAYDLTNRKYAATGDADERVDRMAYDAKRNELLAASPVEGRILRYDADTLAPKTPFKTLFGARVIALDPTRDMMLVGSFATGTIAAQRMSDGAFLKRWYIGPWLRTIVTDPARGRAYVSSNGWLYQLDYAAAGRSAG